MNSIDLDMPSVSYTTYHIPNQVGDKMSSRLVSTRKPSITGYVVADMSQVEKTFDSWEQYMERQKELIDDAKEKLDAFFNPFDEFELTISGRTVTCNLSSPIQYSTKEESNNEVMCLFSIELVCFDPTFIGSTRSTNLASIEGSRFFPLIIPESGFIFGKIKAKKSITVQNIGDVDTGCIIVVKAMDSSIKDPEVYDVNTGEYIGVSDVVLSAGDYVLFNTNVGEESIMLHTVSDGETKSIVNKMKVGSKFIKLKRGTTLLSYRLSDEYAGGADITVNYSERFFNVRGA